MCTQFGRLYLYKNFAHASVTIRICRLVVHPRVVYSSSFDSLQQRRELKINFIRRAIPRLILRSYPHDMYCIVCLGELFAKQRQLLICVSRARFCEAISTYCYLGVLAEQLAETFAFLFGSV